MGSGKATVTIRAGSVNPKVGVVAGKGEKFTGGGLRMEDDGVSGGLGGSVGSMPGVEEQDEEREGVSGGGEKEGLVAPSPPSPPLPGSKSNG